MTSDPPAGLDTVHAVLDRLQDLLSSRDLEAHRDLLTEDVVLFGSAAASFGRDEARGYLGRVLDQPARLRFDWHDVRVVASVPGLVTAAAVGEAVFVADGTEERDALRLSLVLRETVDGWQVQHFHGSVPQRD